ncbi:MAG: response regulator transcription factor [Marinobacter sp.]|uniref:response regulator transcription factor n=1 Tax=Marinobacter sp. TaxID=50741 RepID=UPI003F9E6D10
MTSPHLLIVEDDNEIAEFLAKGLAEEGYNISVRSDARDLLALVRAGNYDLVILDRMLPGVDGVELCQTLRAEAQDIRVLMLTAKDGLDNTIEGLRAGTDDYMTKPFAFGELLARLEVLLRRSLADPPARDEITVGRISINLDMKTAHHDGQDLNLTVTEFTLLRYLAENAGRVLNRTDILRAVWGYEFDPHTNIVEVYIAYLRKKLEQAGASGVIRTSRGFGYLLTCDE